MINVLCIYTDVRRYIHADHWLVLTEINNTDIATLRCVVCKQCSNSNTCTIRISIPQIISHHTSINKSQNGMAKAGIDSSYRHKIFLQASLWPLSALQSTVTIVRNMRMRRYLFIRSTSVSLISYGEYIYVLYYMWRND